MCIEYCDLGINFCHITVFFALMIWRSSLNKEGLGFDFQLGHGDNTNRQDTLHIYVQWRLQQILSVASCYRKICTDYVGHWARKMVSPFCLLWFQNEPPPLPPTRPYTVQGDRRVCFPQFRFMKQNYTGQYWSSVKQRVQPLLSEHAGRERFSGGGGGGGGVSRFVI